MRASMAATWSGRSDRFARADNPRVVQIRNRIEGLDAQVAEEKRRAAEAFGELRGDYPTDDVGAAAGGEGDDQADRPVRGPARGAGLGVCKGRHGEADGDHAAAPAPTPSNRE